MDLCNVLRGLRSFFSLGGFSTLSSLFFRPNRNLIKNDKLKHEKRQNFQFICHMNSIPNFVDDFVILIMIVWFFLQPRFPFCFGAAGDFGLASPKTVSCRSFGTLDGSIGSFLRTTNWIILDDKLEKLYIVLKTIFNKLLSHKQIN